MSNYELKPCPFCGGIPTAEIAYPQKMFRIYCVECCAEMHLYFDDCILRGGSNHMHFDEVTKIIGTLTEMWNERYVDDGNEED